MASIFDYLQDIIISLFSKDPQEAEKRRQLRPIFERLKQVKPPYYKRSTGQLLPGFAFAALQLAYLLQPLGELFAKTIYNEDAKLAERYRDYLAVARLPEQQQHWLAGFTHAAMKDRALNVESPMKELERILREFEQVSGAFSSPEYYSFDLDYTATDRLAGLCRYDFAKLFSLFEPGFDLQKNRKPNFQPAAGQMALSALLDLYFILAGIELSEGVAGNLNALLDRLERERSAAAKEKVKTILSRITKLLSQELEPSLLLSVIRAIKGDPKFAPQTVGGEIPYLHTVKSRLYAGFQKEREKVQWEINEYAIGSDLKALFSGAELLEVGGYDEKTAQMLQAREYESFSRIKPLRILKSFILAHFERQLRDPLKRLLIEGSFANRIFESMFNNTFYGCEGMLGKLRQFEENLKSGSSSVEKIEKYLQLHDQAKPVQLMIAKAVETIEQQARQMVDEGTAYFYNLSVILLETLDDAKQKTPTHVTNIKAIGGRANKEFLASLAHAWNSLSLFIKIMRNFTEIRQAASDTGRGA